MKSGGEATAAGPARAATRSGTGAAAVGIAPRRSRPPFSLLRFHLDVRSHPGMNATLKTMRAHAEVLDLRPASGRDVHGTGALRRGNQSLVQACSCRGRHLSSTELGDWCEGMGPAAAILHADGVAFVYRYERRFVAPRLVPDNRWCERRVKLGNELRKSDLAVLEQATTDRSPCGILCVAVIQHGDLLSRSDAYRHQDKKTGTKQLRGPHNNLLLGYALVWCR